MSEAQSLEDTLDAAKGKEKEYKWLEAAKLYEQALDAVEKGEFFRRGAIQEQISYCLYRRAFQAKSQEEFKKRMRRAIEAYKKAAGCYKKLRELVKTPRMLRCEAMMAYLGYWLAAEVPEKKRLIGECWTLTKQALKAFEEAGSSLEYGRTYDELSPSALLQYAYEWEFQAGKNIIQEAMKYGEQAVNLLSSISDSNELARAYVKTAFYTTAFGLIFISDMDEKDRHVEKGEGYYQKACELSEEAALLELARTPSCTADEFGPQTQVRTRFEKALGIAKKTRDKYLIGTVLDLLAYIDSWRAGGSDDPDKRVKILDRALRYAEDAKQHFTPISFTNPRSDTIWAAAPRARYHKRLADWETNPEKKRDLLEKALAEVSQLLNLAQGTGYHRVMEHAHHTFSLVLEAMALIEANSKEKKRLLEKALEHTEKSIRVLERCFPFGFWDLGIVQSRVSSIWAELSEFEEDSESRKKMLEEAISSLEKSLRLMTKEASYSEKRGHLRQSGHLGWRLYDHGKLFIRLHRLTSNKEHHRRAMKAFEDAAKSFQKLNLFSRMAECYWEIAQGYDALGEYLKACDNFSLASNHYKSAAEKIPQLKDFYTDYSSYTRAWSEIERAKHNHAEKNYVKAREHYEKAADLHESAKRWRCLSPNYRAWARLEEAEDLSRRDDTEASRDLFQQAAELFTEAKKAIQANSEQVEDKDEKASLLDLAEASERRREYCLGRIALEEAKMLDRHGDHVASSRKYAWAADRFQKVVDAMEHESDRQELRPIICLCQAWHAMTQAEAKASPELYLEAAQLFDTAKEHSHDEKVRILALGHSSFCKALEAGTRFEAIRDASLHRLATQHLEGAASYYLKAGFKSASEYAEATQKLLDAYLYVHNAKTETDPAKKARFYMMAEKVLQASAGSYLQAKHPEKQEQVSRLLEKVKKERELALSLTEILHAPLTTSTTATFATPTPTKEKPIGLERFEHADIQAKLILRIKDVKVGEDINLAIELVNAGKAPALLIKVDEVIPEGFEITEVSEMYTFEDSYINLKGKRLNPLKTEDVKVVVQPRSKGTHTIKPRILYIDETGKYKSHEPEPVTVTVKELGIKGWIKGES